MEKYEYTLQECESEKKAILDGCDSLIFLVDRDHRIIWANKSVEKICIDPVGLQCHQVFCDDDSKCINCQVSASFKAGEGFDRSQKSVVRAAKNVEAFYGLQCSPVENRDGEIQKVVVIAEEITERLNLLKQLRHSFNIDAVGTLAGGIAHDFNNILTPIMGYSEILRLDFSNRIDGDWSETLSSIGHIIEAAKRAQNLIKQFLIYSGKAVSRESVLTIHPVIRESLRLVKTTLPKNVALHDHIDDSCGLIKVDPLEIHQIIVNLCKNANEAMEKNGGELTVSLQKSYFTEASEKWVEISVTDNGCGISEELEKRIFEPYYTTKEKTQGTGLGLAIVHGIIQRLGGRINVDSKVDEGTTITLYLPVAEVIEEVEKESDISEYAGHGEHVLLIDDEKQVVRATAGMLRKLGYIVTEMSSAQQSLKYFQAENKNIDLVITDLAMPGLTGIDLCRKMKDINKDTNVLLYSGALQEEEKTAAQQAGVDGFCLKPVTLMELAKNVYQTIS